jgi:hypothetical protein
MTLLDRSQETRKIMWQNPLSSLLHALASLAASQQFDEKICVRKTEFLSDKQQRSGCLGSVTTILGGNCPDMAS